MFECDKCGLCCCNLNESEIYKELDRGDGVCIYYNEHSKLCNIYKSRPLICRVVEMYDAYYKDYITEEEYYKRNQIACEILRRKKE